MMNHISNHMTLKQIKDQLKDDEKVCPCCGATILNDDLSIDEQLDILKNDEIVDNIKVKDDIKIEPEVKIKDDRVSDESIVKVNDENCKIE